jgi:hypothetical protein
VKRQASFIRDLEAGSNLDVFLVSAVGAILVIRFYLHITGYPQIGGGTLHIAHMLWGGLLMLAAILILVSFLSRPATRLAVFLGGIGFGTFIDEVGKFVTKSNDYFFAPAVAIMYAVFVLTYLAIKAIHTRRRHSRTEYLVNALKEMEELAMEDLEEEERDRARVYLERSDPEHPLTGPLKEVLERAELIESRRPGVYARTRNRLRRTYHALVELPLFSTGVVVFFLIVLAIRLSYVLVLVFFKGLGYKDILNNAVFGHIARQFQGLDFVAVAEIVSSLIAGALIFWGAFWIRRSRVRAYEYFRASVLVNLFLTEIFIFAREQFGALIGFSVNILLLVALNYMIARERFDEET